VASCHDQSRSCSPSFSLAEDSLVVALDVFCSQGYLQDSADHPWMKLGARSYWSDIGVGSFSCRPTAICSPIRHQPPASLKEITAPVGSVDLVADRMRERLFDNMIRIGGLLGRPIAEGATEPMRHEPGSYRVHDLLHRLIARDWEDETLIV